MNNEPIIAKEVSDLVATVMKITEDYQEYLKLRGEPVPPLFMNPMNPSEILENRVSVKVNHLNELQRNLEFLFEKVKGAKNESSPSI